jgi:hypothetical protein
MRDFKYNNNRSKFAQHLIDNKHAIGKMEDITEVVHVTKKGKMMDTLEGFHIYKETKAGNQINDRLTVRKNAIFETIVQEDHYRGRAAPLQPKQLEITQLWEAIHPAGKERYTGTEAARRNRQPTHKKSVINTTLYA